VEVRLYFSCGSKWNCIDACTVKPFDTLTVKNASVMFVCYLRGYTICSHVSLSSASPAVLIPFFAGTVRVLCRSASVLTVRRLTDVCTTEVNCRYHRITASAIEAHTLASLECVRSYKLFFFNQPLTARYVIESFFFKQSIYNMLHYIIMQYYMLVLSFTFMLFQLLLCTWL